MADNNSTQPTYGARRSGPKISESHSGRRSGRKIVSVPTDEQMTETGICINVINYQRNSSERFLLRTANFDDLNDSQQFLRWYSPPAPAPAPADASFFAIGSLLYAFGGLDRNNKKFLTNIYYLDVTKHDQGWNKIGYPMLVGRYFPHILLVRSKIVLFDDLVFNRPHAPFGEIHDVSFCGPALAVMPPPTSVPLEGPFLIAPLVSSNQVFLAWAISGIAFLYDLDSYTWKEFDHGFDFKHLPASGRAILLRNDTILCWHNHELCVLYFYDMNERRVSWQPIIGWMDPILDSDSRTLACIFPLDENHIVITWGEYAEDGNLFRCSKIQLKDNMDDNGDPFILCRVVSSQIYCLAEGTCFLSACQLNVLAEREESSSRRKVKERLGKRKLIN